jgi:hypothetical protein
MFSGVWAAWSVFKKAVYDKIFFLSTALKIINDCGAKS